MSELTITEFARLGGIARAAKLTPEQRMAISKKATKALKKKAKERRANLTK